MSDAGRPELFFSHCGAVHRSRALYSEEVRCYVGSFAGTAKEYLLYTRKHWGIENTQHYVLDVTFREDDNRTRKDHGPANLALVRRIALSLLHQEKKTK